MIFQKSSLPIWLSIFMFLIKVSVQSQITYEKGYFIDNFGNKTECLIRNVDWMKNPHSFQYKVSENDDAQTGKLTNILEFGVNGESKFIKATVNIDRSSQEVDKLTLVREPSFSNETLFLMVLVEGKTTLYKYEDSYGPNYFYQLENGKIEPLVYRKYITRDNRVGENTQYKQQLFNELKNPKLNQKRFSNLSYSERDLTKLFKDYNLLNGAVDYLDEKVKGNSKELFNLNIRPGLKFSSLVFQGSAPINNTTKYPSELGFRIGLEFEGILPFNKNKWALFVEPSYQTYKSELILRQDINTAAEVNYNTTEISFGGRHYMFLGKDSKLFLNISYVLAWSNDSKINYNNGYYLELDNSSNLAFGLGYKYKNKYILELNYNLDRGLLPNYIGPGREAVFSSYSIILGYTIF